MKNCGVYPGSFDPITNGHIDVIKRSLTFLDRVILAISSSPRKCPFFSLEERREMAMEIFRDNGRVEVDVFNGLLVSYMREKKINVILRGLRAVSDFEYEFQLAAANRNLDKNIETVFLMPGEEFSFISSSLVREIASLHGDISGFVPGAVSEMVRKKFSY